MADSKKDKKTIYQQLNGFLNAGNFDTDNQQTNVSQSTVSTEKSKIIIKGNSPEEIQRKGLELEQKRKLQDKFFRTTDRGFQKALQYEAARLPAYIDYEGMEYYPIISSALDLYMEEATHIGFNGNMLNIYSNKDRIKLLLEDFFHNIVNVNVNLPFWTRNLPVKYDSMIPLLNGEIITIKEISERIKNNPNETIWTYSIQDDTNTILPSKIIWCDLTRKDSDIIKVNLDDNTSVETSPDHEYMLRNGEFRRADELKAGDSLMPFYTIISKESKGIKGYEKVYNPSSNHHKFTHRMVSDECLRDVEKESAVDNKFITHHINFNKLDNSPENLARLTTEAHSKYHAKLGNINSERFKRPDIVEKRMKGIDKYLRSDSRKKYLSDLMTGIYPQYFKEYNGSELHDEHNIIRRNRMTKLWSSDEYKESTKNKMRLKLDDASLNYIINLIAINNKYIGAKRFGEKLMSNSHFMELFRIANSNLNKDVSRSLSSTTLRKLIYRKTNLNYLEFNVGCNSLISKDKNYKLALKISNTRENKKILSNHKVLSVELLSNKSDVYCMEVVGQNNEQDRHNFPICSKDENGEYSRNGTFVSNCKYGDNFVLLYGERKKGINHVKQMVNYEIERFERIQNGKSVIKFKERMTGDEFNVFEVAHFRLLGDDKFLPYGSSMLNKVRRVFRQLIMAEDAMLTYRIVRAGEKKVFKIDVGNIDDDDIEDYIYKVATKFKKTSQVNPSDGQIDYRFNILGNDEDYFLPVRNANVQTGIDTLPGATNLDSIHDIEYLRDNLFMGLGVPKPFLSFQDAAGGGKNMAQFDIRFAKKVNRIQRALIQELNKMAMIHLHLLGYSAEDVSDFTLSLTNPSIQEEILKSELMRDKSTAYGDLTRGDGGIAAMSHTGAKKLIFNMSDSDIITDLKQQKMEKTVMQELADAPIAVKKSGLFTDLDNRFGTPTEAGEVPEAPDSEDGEGTSPEMGGAPPAPPVGGMSEPPDAGIALGEGKMDIDEFEKYITDMIGSSSKEKVKEKLQKEEGKRVITENNDTVEEQNERAKQMIREMDNILESPEISTEFDGIDLEGLTDGLDENT